MAKLLTDMIDRIFMIVKVPEKPAYRKELADFVELV